MEPSLRSSSHRSMECKLRKTDPALHETIQRFVESQDADVRISQYADLHFASKKFSENAWYWLKQQGFSGYLVFLPGYPIVWMDEQFNKSFKIQMSVSSLFMKQPSILVASLLSSDGLLRLEDMWLSCGGNLMDKPFTQRWNKLLEFFATSYKFDASYQQGLRIETAVYMPLVSMKDWPQPYPHTVIAQGEIFPRRLRVQMQAAAAAPATAPRKEKEKQTIEGIPQVPRRGNVVTKKLEAISYLIATVIAVPDFPDTYNVFINGVKKGFAAVQDIDLSRRLREVKTKDIRVKVEWNQEFSMYEINDLL